MSNYWGTPQDHNKDVRRQIAFEKGETVDESTTSTETKEDETFQPEVPTVVLPDGTRVKVDEYDPYVKEREELQADKFRTEGVLAVLRNQGQQNDTGTEQPTQEEETPAWKPFEFGDDEMPNETDLKLAGHLNEFGEQVGERFVDISKGQTSLAEAVKDLASAVNSRFLEDDLRNISVRTGFSREQLIQANEETGIDDPNMVATYLKGKQAEADALKQKTDDADDERKRQASGVTGTTGGGGGVEDTRDRGKNPPKIDYTDPAQVSQHFQFGKQAD